MLLTITSTHPPASDLGFLLEKHPAKLHEFDVAGGKAMVFYPEASEQRCTVALLLEVDPIGLVRGQGRGKSDHALDQYVNDRPYVASSFLSVSLGVAFRSALAGKSRSRPELATTAIPLEAHIAVLPCRGGEAFLRGLFEPLGYEVSLTQLPLDEQFPEWGESPYFSVTLRALCTVQQLLQHLYVLIPVLDDGKHYWVGDAEVDKLVRHAGEWLGDHPLKDRIAYRYLKHRRSLVREALGRLVSEEVAEVEVVLPEPQVREQNLEAKISLNQTRLATVSDLVEEIGGKSAIDLGCGEGRLLTELMKIKRLDRIVGVDVSMRVLDYAQVRLNFDRMPPRQRERIELMHGSLIYRDDRLKGFDVATVIEVIEHLDLARLAALERVLFEFARPQFIIVTTPNSEYNVRFANLKPGQFRHGDHRFEWTREQFRAWCERQASRFGYSVSYRPVGEDDALLGPPTQMAVFESIATAAAA
jgi:3' terminal RNA ribose 2'-O-methyltransferase Hen1